MARVADDLHALADAISNQSPRIKAFAEAVADRLEPAAPPGTGTLLAYDATRATLLANQEAAQYVASHVSGSGAVFSASVAVAAAAMPTTTITATGVTAAVPLPAGVQPGGSNDHHLAVGGFDLWGYDAEARTAQGLALTSGVREQRPGSATAARLALRAGLVTADELAAGTIGHAIPFGVPLNAVSGVASVYPADTDYNDPRCVYGQWLRLDPAGPRPAYSSPIVALFDAALRAHGMFCRDTSDSLTLYGQDYVNTIGNAAAYGSAGLSLTLPGTSGYPIGAYLQGIPWDQLQALAPPAA